jgi:mannose-6-phosphate isomerase-like protein (cupin superfamily)
MKVGAKPYALAKGEGQAIWFLNNLMTVKAGGEETGNAFTLIESVAGPGFAPPPHIHHAEDEAFYVLEGEVTFSCGDRSWKGGPGTFAYLPRDVAHQFKVSDSGPLRMLQLTLPAQFEKFAAEVGEPARTRDLPEPSAPDVAKLEAASRKYRIEIVPPE